MKTFLLLITILTFSFSYGQVEEISDDESFKLNQIFLVTDKCNNENGRDRNNCVRSELDKLIDKEFNWVLTENLKSGRHKINLMFKIDINGTISNIKIRSKEQVLISELERVLKTIPKKLRFINQDGETVSGHYSLPLLIYVEK